MLASVPTNATYRRPLYVRGAGTYDTNVQSRLLSATILHSHTPPATASYAKCLLCYTYPRVWTSACRDPTSGRQHVALRGLTSNPHSERSPRTPFNSLP